MRVAVGAVTRQRPAMFSDLLESFAAMERPKDVEVVFLFAENDTEHHVEDVVARFRDRVPEEVRLELEPRPGIPMARNRVLDMALSDGADFLTFVDDDEVVTAQWLAILVSSMKKRQLDLAGAPVRLVAPEGELTGWNRSVLEHLQSRSVNRNRSRERSAQERRDGWINIYTNNWILRLAAQRELGVRFDESLQFTGGSDTKFSIDMKAAGARIGWIPRAYVEEPTPQKRLTLPYHFRRARDQATNAVRLSDKGAGKALTQAFLRFIDAILNTVSSVFTGRYGITKAVHKLGIAAGHIRGAFGGRSQHYGEASAGFHTEKRD